MKLFISYNREDTDLVDVLSTDLRAMGHDPWFDLSIAGGSIWWEAILEEIRGCDVFIWALTRTALKSPPCLAEFEYALSVERLIIPVQLGDLFTSEFPEALRRIQVVDYRRKDKTAALALSRALWLFDAKPLPDPLPPPPVCPPEVAVASILPPFPGRPAHPAPEVLNVRFEAGIFQVHDCHVQLLVPSPDGRWLLTGASDRSCAIWDLANRKIHSILRSGSLKPPFIWDSRECRRFKGVFLPDGKSLITAESASGCVQCHTWDIETGSNVFSFKLAEGSLARYLSLTPDGGLLAVGGYTEFSAQEDDYTRCFTGVWDVFTGVQVGRIDIHEVTENIAISPDGLRLLVSNEGVDAYDLRSGGFARVIPSWRSLEKPYERDGEIEFSSDGRYFATGCMSYPLRFVVLWHSEMRQELRRFVEEESLESFAIAPSNRLLATVKARGATLWDMFSGKKLEEVKPLHADRKITASTFSRLGDCLILGYEDGSVEFRPCRVP